MTSLTVQNPWTAPTMLSLWTEPTPKRAKVAHRISNWVNVIDTAVRVLCPPVVTVAVIFAAAAWPAPTHSGPVGNVGPGTNAAAQATGAR